MWSHPFVERLIGTIRRECLDQTLFWTTADLEAKLRDFLHYYNGYRAHAGLGGRLPEPAHGRQLRYSRATRIPCLSVRSAILHACSASVYKDSEVSRLGRGQWTRLLFCRGGGRIKIRRTQKNPMRFCIDLAGLRSV